MRLVFLQNSLQKVLCIYMGIYTYTIVTKADKGNVTVALNKDNYIEKMEEIVSDNNTYEVINKDPIKKLTSDLRSLLVRWKGKKFFDSTYRRLLTTDDIILRAYGLTKIHKQGNPLRIIWRSTMSVWHGRNNIVNDSILEAPSYIKNSFHLIEKLKDVCIEPKHLLVSLDVISLFMNVPIEVVLQDLERIVIEKLPFKLLSYF
ncbi:hypothetical protein ALC60_09284 [Trachymyrmex zeteki]|uniref:Reverse transcriptase domain-containing protein n=1 Tax=Mycetomoellerius zeteki TaxID=64791 RepID=A0A151WUM1_9HYME|nr:hypothetical protein ALC60_09284 [Trachymyrmex zeteki]